MDKKPIFFETKKDNNVVLTPPWVINRIEELLNIKFDFDPCPENAHLNNIDNLKTDSVWGNFNFCNPPYVSEKGKNNGIKGFLEKAIQQSRSGKTTVFLIPFNCASNYFQNLVYPNFTTLIILSKEIKFINSKTRKEYNSTFPIPLCIVEFNPNKVKNNLIKREIIFGKKPAVILEFQ